MKNSDLICWISSQLNWTFEIENYFLFNPQLFSYLLPNFPYLNLMFHLLFTSSTSHSFNPFYRYLIRLFKGFCNLLLVKRSVVNFATQISTFCLSELFRLCPLYIDMYDNYIHLVIKEQHYIDS